MTIVLMASVAAAAMSLWPLAATTYHNVEAAGWWLKRVLPLAAAVHIVALVVQIAGGSRPSVFVYLAGLLLAMMGLPVVLATNDRIARRVRRLENHQVTRPQRVSEPHPLIAGEPVDFDGPFAAHQLAERERARRDDGRPPV